MIDAERWAEARRLRRAEGYSIRAIARHLSMARETVRRALSQETYRAAPAEAKTRGSMIEPFHASIRGHLEEHPELSAVQVLGRIAREGYTGEITLVRRAVRELRESQAGAFLTLTHLPGECAQVDWAYLGTTSLGRVKRRVSAFVMVLAYSRLLYVEATLSERMDAFLEAHARAFQFFGGVPRRLLYDGCRTVVLQRAGGGIRFHPRLLEFADHHLFQVRACPPRKPWCKGVVESGIGYLRKSFRLGKGPIEDPDRLRRDLETWRDTIANERLHTTTRRKPRELFEEAERPALLPLPENAFDTAHLEPSVSANKAYRVHFDGNRYSVPHALAHRRGLTLRATTAEVEIYAKGELVARHPRSYGRGEDVRDDAHDRGLRDVKRRAGRDLLLGRLVAILGPEAEAYAFGLARAHVQAARHLRRILALADRYGAQDVREALLHAKAFDAYGADYVENVLHQKRRQRLLGPVQGPVQVADPELFAIALPEPDLTRFEDLSMEGDVRDRETTPPEKRSPGPEDP